MQAARYEESAPGQAISQNLRSQQEVRSQFICLHSNYSNYCHTGSCICHQCHSRKVLGKMAGEKFTNVSEEPLYRSTLQDLKNKPLTSAKRTNCFKNALGMFEVILMRSNRKIFSQPSRTNTFMVYAAISAYST